MHQPDPASPPWVRPVVPSGPRRRSLVRRLASVCLRGSLALALLVVIALGIGYWRLTQGPVQLPVLADLAQAAVNAGTDQFQVQIGGAALALRRGGTQPALQFQDVSVLSPAGAPLMSVPRLGVGLSLPDLALGRLRPVSIVLIGAEARVVRTRSGRVRFGLGAGGLDMIGGQGEGGAGADAVAEVLNGLVGDAPPIAELTALQRIAILNADLSYDYKGSGRVWRTTDADFRIERTTDGIKAALAVSVTDAPGAPTAQMLVDLRRKAGTRRTEIDFGLRGVRPRHLADQLEALAWLRLIDAPMQGDFHLDVGDDGTVDTLTGSIQAGPGSLLAEGARGQPFDKADLAFAYDPGLERMRIERGTLASDAVVTRMDGFFDLRRDADGGVIGLDAQLGVHDMGLHLPDLFTDRLAFNDGQIVGRLDLDPLRIEVVEARLSRGDLGFRLNGTSTLGPQGWQTRLRAEGASISIADLIAHWPLPAAVNARNWVTAQLTTGQIDRMVAHLDLAEGSEQLGIDFRFSGLGGRYLDPMSPIVGASGFGSLTDDELRMTFDSGGVEPLPGQFISLAGSKVRIYDFSAPVTPADIEVSGQGPIPAIVALIDQQPLGLVGKLGADLSGLRGAAEVAARLRFPVAEDLALEQVDTQVQATLRDVVFPFAVAGRVIDIAADQVALNADTTQMQITGPVVAEGTPVTLDWRERFSGAKAGREVRLKGALSPELLTRLELPFEDFTGGKAPATLVLTQSSGGPVDFTLDANLGPASLRMGPLNWTKAVGPNARLTLAGRVGATVSLSEIALEAPDFTLDGSAELDAAGDVRSARIGRLTRGDLADLALDIEVPPDGPIQVEARGARLDVALFDPPKDAPPPPPPTEPVAPGPPFAIRFDIDALRVTPMIELQPGRGIATRDAAGDLTAVVSGQVGGRAAIDATYTAPATAPARVRVTAPDAGALLSAAGLFEGGVRGSMTLDAEIAPAGGADLTGLAQIADMTIRQAPSLETILEEGALDEAARASREGGIGFDSIRVPFSYHGDQITLGSSVAAGPLLAVKLDGTVDQTNGAIDLVGVISPAYGLTGALDNIPLLGDILTGGKGEGIFALTFTATGTLADSNITVNPLSLLTPGILRNIFSGRVAEPDAKFLEQLQRN